MKNVFLIIIFNLLLNSCVSFYQSNAHNTPLFKKENQLKVSSSLSLTGDNSKYESQLAYSLNDKFAVMFNAANGFVAENAIGTGNTGSYFYNELAFGTYKQFDKYIIGEIYLGGGLGLTDKNTKGFFNKELVEHITSNFTKLWLQPNIGFSYKIIETTLSLRFSQLYFYKTEFIKKYDYEVEHEIDLIDHNKHNFLIEPALTFRVAWGITKFQLQGGLSTNTTNPDMKKITNTKYINFGIILTVDDLF